MFLFPFVYIVAITLQSFGTYLKQNPSPCPAIKVNLMLSCGMATSCSKTWIQENIWGWVYFCRWKWMQFSILCVNGEISTAFSHVTHTSLLLFAHTSSAISACLCKLQYGPLHLRSCLCIMSFLLNVRKHLSHGKALSPVCTVLWRRRWALLEKGRVQILHTYFPSGKFCNRDKKVETMT